MKMTRQDLKSLVKECLVEILSDGLVESSRSVNENNQHRAAPVRQTQQTTPAARPERSTRSMVADKISFLPETRQEMRRAPHQIEQSNRQLVSGLTSDPILAEMFADTARHGGHTKITETSAPHKMKHEDMIAVGGDAAAKAMLRSDPTSVFGESANKWAALAFADTVPVRSSAG